MQLFSVGGNTKLGPGVASTFQPPGRIKDGGTCLDVTRSCIKECYWKQLLLTRPQVRRAGEKRLQMFRDDPEGWESQIVHEVEAARPVAVRFGVGGEFVSASQASHLRRAVVRLQLEAQRAGREPAPWWLYFRSWVRKSIRDEMAALALSCPHVQVWCSADRDNCRRLPADLRPFRWAWMACDTSEQEVYYDYLRLMGLVFPTRKCAGQLKRANGGKMPTHFGGVLICPHDRLPGVTCRSCGICWKPGTRNEGVVPW